MFGFFLLDFIPQIQWLTKHGEFTVRDADLLANGSAQFSTAHRKIIQGACLYGKERAPFIIWNVMQANIFCFLQCQASILITKDVSNILRTENEKQDNKSSKDRKITLSIWIEGKKILRSIRKTAKILMQFMNLSRCSHPIREERAGAKSKFKGRKVTVENGVVAPEGRSRRWNSPLVAYSQHKETANTSHPTFWSIQVFAPMACVQMHQDHVWAWWREADAESESQCPSQLLEGHFGCASSKICEPSSRILQRNHQKCLMLASLAVLLHHLSFSETPWKFIPAKLP